MNKRIRQKQSKDKCMKFVKVMKRELPGIKLLSVEVYNNDYFFVDMIYKDILVHYDSLYEPNKVLIEFKGLLDKWRDWRVYHDIEVKSDLKSTAIEIKHVLNDIYKDYTSHFVNSLIREHYIDDINELSNKIDISPVDYYKDFKNKKKEAKLNELKVHGDNLNYLRSLNSLITRIDFRRGEYEIEFEKDLSDDEMSIFFKEASKIDGILSDTYYFLNKK